MKRYSLLLAVGMALAAWGLSGEEAEPKPVCELKLDGTAENTGSGKLAAAIVRPANVRWGEGRVQGKALFLDNDLSNPKKRSIYSAVTLAGKEKFNPAEPFTVSMWIMPAPETTSCNCSLFSTFAGDFGKGFRLQLNRGTFSAQFGSGKKASCHSIMARRTRFPVRTDAWNHVAATYDGETCRIYLNGIPCGEAKAKMVPGTDLSIGAFLKGYGYAFRGGISQVRIYKQALTGLQILSEARDGLK